MIRSLGTFSLLCLELLSSSSGASASSLLLADRRQKEAANGGRQLYTALRAMRHSRADPIPGLGSLGTAADPNPPPPISANSPESLQNVADYNIAQPTPLPAAFNGVYCKGGACQYRVVPPPPTLPPPMTPPPLPVGGNVLSGREFCRGLTCIPGLGAPGDANLAAFNFNCLHLFQDVLGGLVGKDDSRTVVQVHESFVKMCQMRVGPLEVGACPTYADTFVGAVAPKVDKATVGGVIEICTDVYWFQIMYKQAEIDLKLTQAALPKEAAASLLANSAWNRFGSGGVGPSSARGIKWRQWAWKHNRWPSPPKDPRQLSAEGSFATAAASLVDLGAPEEEEPKPLIPGADADADTPRGLPKYQQNTPCASPKERHEIPQKHTMYQILPGCPDGACGPVEISGDLFTYCANQFSEIMMGFAQTAPQVVQMTKDWCAWQASVSSWIGKKEEFGHPDWNHRTCSNMANLVAFNLRDQLDDVKTGLSSQQVCKKMFLGIGAVHRTDGIMKEAWQTSLRAAPEGGGIPSGDNPEMKKLLEDAQRYADKIFSKLREQKSAFEELNNAKMDTSAFDSSDVEVAPPPPPAPDLPDASDMDPTALLATSVSRVRSVGLLRSAPSPLESFGSGSSD